MAVRYSIHCPNPPQANPNNNPNNNNNNKKNERKSVTIATN